LASIPQNKQLKYLQREIAKLPPAWREPVENLVSLGRRLEVDSRAPFSSLQLIFVAAAFLVLGSAGIFFASSENRLARVVSVLVFALGMGFVGAAVPGVLEVKASKWMGMRIDATSGTAFFVIALLVLLKYL
jgi:hypothetical protein